MIFHPELRGCAPRTTFALKSCDFPAAAGARSAHYVCTSKLRLSSRSCRSTLRVLRLYLKAAIFHPELQEHAPRTTCVLKSCDFQAGAAGVCSAYYVCTSKLRFSSLSCGSTLRTTSVLKSYEFPAGAAGARSAYYVCT